MKRDPRLKIVILGNLKEDSDQVVEAITVFSELGVEVISPLFTVPKNPAENFVLSYGESGHLKAIKKAHFLYLVDPEGRVDQRVSLEIGYALVYHKPVFALKKIADDTMGSFCQGIGRPKQVLKEYRTLPQPLLPRLTVRPTLIELQDYLHQVAIEREFDVRAPKDVMLLLVEEIGELARSLCKQKGLKSGGQKSQHCSQVEGELADCLIYLLDLANGLDVDLEKAFRLREEENERRFWERSLRS